MYTIQDRLSKEIQEIRDSGLYKNERIITSPQAADITLANGSKVLNFCANNYLGLSSHPKVIEAAKKAVDSHGYGMSSVRFICGGHYPDPGIRCGMGRCRIADAGLSRSRDGAGGR